MLQPGTLFDNRYKLIKLIGRGGFAEVWLVKDTLTSLEEALKIYAPGEGLDEDGLKVFIQELTVVHNMHHPYLLTPNMLGQYDSQPYLIMQYCPNGSLSKMIGHCTEGEAWKIIEQVASGLAYLHKRKIVHQDIKPDNILVDANLDCMITDFGISLKAQSTLRKSMLVQANSGTMAYMAPERFSSEPHPIPANDIWSLGAMMFELIEGNVPFVAQMGGLAQKNGADIPMMHADVSDNLKQVILSMLDVDVEKRPTAEQLVEYAKSKKAPSQSSKATVILPKESTMIEERKMQIPNRDTLPMQSESQLRQEHKVYKVPQQRTSSHAEASSRRGRKNSFSTRDWVGVILGMISVLIVVVMVGLSNTKRTGDPQNPYVDLGLPSGTLWKYINEEDFYTQDEAVEKFGKSLPSQKQWKELKDKCTWTWTKYGYKVKGPNGNHIFLPAAGRRSCDGSVYYVGSDGHYWSSTPNASRSAWHLYFDSSVIYMGSNYRCGGRSVRLVR